MAHSSASVCSPSQDDFARCDELGRRIIEYKAWLNAGEFQWLSMVREFDQQALWRHAGICSCAHWLSLKCGIGMSAAREKVRVANALGNLPKVSERYARGELSYSKVRAITRIATPETEDQLLEIARRGTASRVEELVSKFRRGERLEEIQKANRQQAERELSWSYDRDGVLILRGRFPAEQGALIVKALEFATELRDQEVWAERQRLRTAAAKSKATNGAAETGADTRDGTSAGNDVSAEAIRRDEPGAEQTGNDLFDSDVSEEVRPVESFAARQAEALSLLAESYLVHGPKRASTADRFQVVVHVSAETLKADSAGHDVSAETPDLFENDVSCIENGPLLPAETARRISCDASMINVVDDEEGEPLNIGRKSRVIPPSMRRALRMRDDGCRFPGCTHKYFIDGHHIDHWADGGETSMANLVQLCRHHHRLVHEGGFGCERRQDGTIVFTSPGGERIPQPDFLPPITPGSDPVEWLKGNLKDAGGGGSSPGAT